MKVNREERERQGERERLKAERWMRQRKEAVGGTERNGKEMVDAGAMKQMRSVTEGDW